MGEGDDNKEEGKVVEEAAVATEAVKVAEEAEEAEPVEEKEVSTEGRNVEAETESEEGFVKAVVPLLTEVETFVLEEDNE